MLFPHVSRHTRREHAGHSIEFCPICRAARTFEATYFRIVTKVAMIPFTTSRPFHLELGCVACRVALSRDPRTTHVWNDAELVSAGPDILDHPPPKLARRLELESRLDCCSMDEREFLLSEPFIELNYSVAAHQMASAQTSTSAVIAVLAGILTIAAIVLWFVPQPAWITGSVTAGAVLFILWTIRRYTRIPRAAARRLALEPLATALRPLHPKPAELEHTPSLLRARKLRLAKLLTPADILEALERPP